MLSWELKTFYELSLDELYEIMAARQIVFAVDQECGYLDADGFDQNAHHLIGWDATQDPHVIAAYIRILPPGAQYDEPSIGRVITMPAVRGMGYGKDVMKRGIETCEQLYPGMGIRISAQQYLERFYNELGFKTVSEAYIEDHIPHIKMLRD